MQSTPADRYPSAFRFSHCSRVISAWSGAEARVRAGMLLGELLTLKEMVQDMNYGQARGRSSPFFDHVRAEAGRSTDAGIKQALESINTRCATRL